MPFDGRWARSFGRPELTGSWIIWGDSGNGKSRFALQLAKQLAQYTTVLYNNLEEGVSLSFQKALREENMDTVTNFKIIDGEEVDELIKRLKRKRSPRVIIIDSLQYAGLTYSAYKRLRAMFPRKLFIFVSHANGRLPDGRTANKIRYDAFIKIRIEGFKAFPMSRYGGGEPYVIWKIGADEYWSNIQTEKQ